MSDSTPSVCKTISWLLAILLIGVVVLYKWHDGNQRETLAAKDAQIAQSAQLLADVEQGLDQSEQASKTLHAEKQELSARLGASEQANLALQGDLKTLAAQHAGTLAAEQEKARGAFGELQGRHKEANERIAALGADIERIQQMAKDAAAAHLAEMTEAKNEHEARLAEIQAAHEAKSAELERRMGEKIDFYRKSLEGTDPERAALLAGLERQIEDGRQTIEEARRAMQAMEEKQADLQQRLAGADRMIAERDRALSENGAKLQDIRAELERATAAREALQREHDATLDETAQAVTKLRQELQSAEAAHQRIKEEAAAELQAAKSAHAAQITEAEDKIAALTDRLQTETAALEALQQRHSSVVPELREKLSESEQTLSRVESELSETKEAAIRAKQAHERQSAEAQSKITVLEQTLTQTRRQAAEDLAVSQREGEEALANLRGLFGEFSELRGLHTDRGILLNLAEEELQFRTSKADLPKGELPSLDLIAELFVKHPKLTAAIEGHTDSRGRDETNLELSAKRADAVKQALVERGVNATRLTAQGIGAARPIADNASAAGRRRNRRVEIYVIENRGYAD